MILFDILWVFGSYSYSANTYIQAYIVMMNNITKNQSEEQSKKDQQAHQELIDKMSEGK